jgi:superfamily II DNA or RNA helicase
LRIFPSHILAEGPLHELQIIRDRYYFRDKAAEYQLARHERSAKYSEITGSWRYRFDSIEDFQKWKLEETAKLTGKLDVYCCDWILDESQIPTTLRIPIGLLSSVQKLLTDAKIVFRLEENRDFQIPFRRLKGYSPELRPPQLEAISRLEQAGWGNGLARMATGVGKTVVGQELIRVYGVESIFLVPSASILRQTVSRFIHAFGKMNVGAYGDGSKKHSYVTVATYQSVCRAKEKDLEMLRRKRLIIGDEIHHVGADTFYHAVEVVLSEAIYRFGLTADEERADGGTVLIEAAIGPVLYSYEAPRAIADGYLAKPTFFVYEVHVTQGTFKSWKTKDGERVCVGAEQAECYIEADAGRAYKHWVLGNDLLTAKICQTVLGFMDQGLNVLILIDEKEHGDKLMAHLGDRAGLVVGGGKDNEEILERFNARELRGIVGTSTIGEGTDTITVDVLVNLMGGQRPKQANGRALRNDPDPETRIPRKPTCIIIDFDFPLSPPLTRHCEARVAVHETCGPVYRSRLL